jgi:signal transduction histidine kinase
MPFAPLLPAPALLRHLPLLGALLGAPAAAFAQTPALPWQALGGLWLGGLLCGLALALMLLAMSHRWERRLMLVAAACLSWAGLLMLPTPADAMVLPLQVMLAVSLLALLLRQADLRHRGLDLLVLLPAALALALAWALPNTLGVPIHAGLPVLLGIELLLVAAVFLWRRWRLWLRLGLSDWREVAQQVQHTVLPLLVATAVGGLLLHWGRQRELPLSVGLLLALLALGLVMAFARRRQHAEQHLRSTEQHLQERLAEQERHHQQLSDQRLEQVTERERKRIAGDLHDDLGAKLLTIVHTSDNERISSLAREALEEMRLSVRGLTGRPVQLLDAIGDWRAEVVSRLAQSNIEAEWVSLAEEVAQPLPARAYVQTTRIIRESISNVIKHSGATRCVVRCALADGDFQLVIQDNGKGVPTEKDGRLDRGHGMASMKSRAKQMQGQCLVESGPGWGTLIRLNIPL